MFIQITASGAQKEAQEEVDYSIGASQHAFGLGQIQREITPQEHYLYVLISIIDDNIPEGSESFNLVISAIPGRPQFTTGQSVTTVTIVDNDGKCMRNAYNNYYMQQNIMTMCLHP